MELGPLARRSGRQKHATRRSAAWMVALSKSASCVLRHTAQRLGLSITPGGYVPIEQLITTRSLQRLRILPKDIELLARSDGARRFQVSIADGARVARALHGHSMDVVADAALLRALAIEDLAALPARCVHGTSGAMHASNITVRLVGGGRTRYSP